MFVPATLLLDDRLGLLGMCFLEADNVGVFGRYNLSN
jgi:hypothetical protein